MSPTGKSTVTLSFINYPSSRNLLGEILCVESLAFI